MLVQKLWTNRCAHQHAEGFQQHNKGPTIWEGN
jgi:hypothetical protein